MPEPHVSGQGQSKAFKDKEKPAQVRESNITAAKVISVYIDKNDFFFLSNFI